MSDNINKVVVIYKSKYGSAQRYAQWIADEVKADLFERSKITLNDILKYDTIVYGGSLYAAGILGISLIKKNFDKLKDKKVIVFSVGASPAHPEAINDMSYYAIDLWDVRQNFKISEEDKELIVSYLNASELTIYDITNSVQEKENMFDYIIISRIFKVMANKYRALDSKYLKLYKSSIKKDFELEELKTQIYCLKEQIKRLECENEQLKENVKIVSLDKVREKEKEIIDIKKQYNEIIKEKDKMIEENNEEIQLLKMTVEDLLDESHYVNEEQITNDALTGIRGVIIGGTPQWQQHMRKIVPHFKIVGTEQLNYDTKILENADKIYFNTAYNSHAMFYKTMIASIYIRK